MEQIRIDLIPNGVMPNIHASQFDHGRTIRFNLYEGESPFSLLATDYVKVACNNNISVSLANAGNSHDWTIPDSVVADSGVFVGELTIERNSVIVGSKNFVLNVEEDAYNGKNIEERTASGTIANFETNLQDNLTACKCSINPVQNLNGYTKPWSGGAGKNKVDFPSYANASSQNLTIQTTGNGGFKVTGTPSTSWALLTSQIDVNIPSGQAITFGITGGTLSHKVYLNLTYADSTTDTLLINSGNTSKTMTLAKNLIKVRLDYSGMSTSTNYNETIYPMLEYGSTQSAFEPFENICPISGFNGATIVRCGKNFAQTSLTGINIDSSGRIVPYATFDMVIAPVKAGQTYTATNNESNQFICGFFASLPSQGSQSYNNNRVVQSSKTITAPIDGYIAFRVPTGFANYQFELGNQASTYEPYNGQTATVNFGQTVYGGVLDVTNGKLRVTHKSISIDNNSSWSSSGNSAYLNITDAKIVNEYANAISDKYEYNTWSGVTNGDNGFFTLYQNTAWSNARLAFNRNGLSLADFITSLTNNPIEVVYELATPTELTLTPKQIEAIVGINNVFHDCNGETEVKYLVEV